jgi:hypothetical protein
MNQTELLTKTIEHIKLQSSVSSNKLHIEQFQAMSASYFRTKSNYSCINNSESHTIKGVNLSNKHIPNSLPINIS